LLHFDPMEGGRTKFPLTLDLEAISKVLLERKFIVVSFFGKTTYAARGNKGQYIDEMTGCSDFGGETEGDAESNAIEVVIDRERDIIFLHMRSCMDAYVMAEKCKKLEESMRGKGFLSLWSSKRYEHAKALLFLFQVSHILVCVQPGHTVDISYIHLFKSLDNLRNKLQGPVAKLIRDVPGLAKEWINQGRLCSPRVLFLFLSAPLSLRGTRGLRDDRKDAKPHRNIPIKRLEFSLEDQIYRILRKARIITNIAGNSLFALPANQEFVFVETGNEGTRMDPSTGILNSLYAAMNGDTSDQFAYAGPFYSQQFTEEMKPKRSFARFLSEHINKAFEKGFYDNVNKYGSTGGTSLWEIPSLSHWTQVANLLYRFFTETLTSAEGHENSHAMCDLRDDLEIETIFSELRCKKILPKALAVYEENLPAYYNLEYHTAKLIQAMSVFSMQARGPASEKFAERLAESCQDIWRAGRVRCEELSLTGHLCQHRKHALPGQEVMQEETSGERVVKKALPSLTHSSGVQYIAACNCGRKQANREDPFSVYEANCGFYNEQEEDCCKDLNHTDFPVYTPAQKSEGATLLEDGVERRRSGEHKPRPETLDIKAKLSDNNNVNVKERKESGDMAVESRDAGTPTVQDDEEIILEVLENIHIDAPTATNSTKVESLLTRPGNQFLTHMKTRGSQPGLKPEFSSWSLVQLGSSHLYSHGSGLGNMPGFMSSSKFLLPWEVPLTKANEGLLAAKFPNILEYTARRATILPPEELKEHMTVKVFIGFEYECPRGNRFMVSAPDKPMKSSSTVQGAAQKLVSSDMPLYMACPCRSKNPFVAQLMRIHVVTPKAPLYITLFPQVEGVPGGPVFVTGLDTPARLSISSYWVLRLPYVYSGEGGAHLPPPLPPADPLQAGFIKKGCISVDENYEDS